MKTKVARNKKTGEEVVIDLDTLLVAYKIGAITLDEIKRFIKLKN